jgi:hypothetical protein
METFPPLMAMWRDDPSDPGRLTADDPRVRRLIDRIAPGSVVTDLGGTYSLNVLLEPAGLVLRVHQSFVSRARLLAVQELKCALGARGACVATALAINGDTVLRSGNRWAEVEPYLPGEKPAPSTVACPCHTSRRSRRPPRSGGGCPLRHMRLSRCLSLPTTWSGSPV